MPSCDNFNAHSNIKQHHKISSIKKRNRKHKKICPTQEILANRLKRKTNKLPNIFQNIKNKGINLSDRKLSLYDECVLSLGLKFIIKPKSARDSTMQ
jgi:hypothetical protein